MAASRAGLKASNFRTEGRAGVTNTIDALEKERLRNKAHIVLTILQAADFAVSVGLGALLLVVEPYFFITVAVVVAWFMGRTVLVYFYVRDIDTMIEVCATNLQPFTFANLYRPLTGHIVSVFEVSWYILGGLLVTVSLFWANLLSDDTTALILHAVYVLFILGWKMAHHIALFLLFRDFAYATAIFDAA